MRSLSILAIMVACGNGASPERPDRPAPAVRAPTETADRGRWTLALTDERGCVPRGGATLELGEPTGKTPRDAAADWRVIAEGTVALPFGDRRGTLVATAFLAERGGGRALWFDLEGTYYVSAMYALSGTELAIGDGTFMFSVIGDCNQIEQVCSCIAESKLRATR